MANTYIWTVKSMECYPTYQSQTDVVFTVNAIVTATDDSTPPFTSSAGLSMGINYDESEQYIPYADLTQDIVIGWVQEALGQEGIANIESTLDSQIANMVNPTITTLPLPWVI